MTVAVATSQRSSTPSLRPPRHAGDHLDHNDTLRTVGKDSTPKAKPSSEEVLERLQEAYPQAFTIPPKPLQIGIHKIIRAAKPASLKGLANKTISESIGRWVRQDAYLEAVRNREPRHDLRGRPTSDVSDEAVESAAKILRNRKQRQGNAQRKKRAHTATKAVADPNQPSSTGAA